MDILLLVVYELIEKYNPPSCLAFRTAFYGTKCIVWRSKCFVKCFDCFFVGLDGEGRFSGFWPFISVLSVVFFFVRKG